MTAATWKYDTGAVGTLLHGTSLHGGEYAIELEVYADGVSCQTFTFCPKYVTDSETCHFSNPSVANDVSFWFSSSCSSLC